eukprot:16451413-Heterocapsa_arctica.AAC.1
MGFDKLNNNIDAMIAVVMKVVEVVNGQQRMAGRSGMQVQPVVPLKRASALEYGQNNMEGSKVEEYMKGDKDWKESAVLTDMELLNKVDKPPVKLD